MPNDKVRTLLSDEIAKRRLRNPSYSLRAFARDLGISLTALSDALNGKRRLARKNLVKLSEALMLSPEETSRLIEVTNQQLLEPHDPYELMTEDVFRLIGDWHYFAILNLAKLPEARADATWMAKRLGISVREANEALDRLKRLQFVKQCGRKLVRTARPLKTSRDIPSTAIRKHHIGNLKLAEAALLDVPLEQREFGSTITPMNLEQMREIKTYLQKVRGRVADIAEKGPCTDVYCLSIQFFPLTKQNSIHSNVSTNIKNKAGEIQKPGIEATKPKSNRRRDKP